MTPLIKVENSIGNVISIQNTIEPLVSTYLSRDTTVGSTTILVENTTGFKAYSTTVSAGAVGVGTQTWTVGSSANILVNDIIVTTGAATNVVATVTAINSSTSITVNVVTTGSGTATGLSYKTPILIGSIGNENAELSSSINIVSKTSASMVSAVSMYHLTGEGFTEIVYDKIEIYKSSPSTGTFSQLATIDINVKDTVTTFKDSNGLSTDFYKIRFVNSGTQYLLSGQVSYYGATDFATATSTSSLSSDTAGALIESVKNTLGIPADDKDLTTQWFISALNDARRIYDTDFTFGRNQEWRQEFNFPIKMKAGTNFVDLPADIDFSETNRSMLRLRLSRSIGGYNQPIRYMDKAAWNSILTTSSFATNPSSVAISATSIVLDNTGDMPTSGTVFVATTDYTTDILTVNYTGNNKDTNTLTGVTGVTRIIPANTQFWLNPVTAIPSRYTVWNGVVYFDRPIPQSLQGKNVYLDYYKKITDISLPTEIVPEHFRDIYKHYLKFAVKKRRDDNIGESDSDYKMFLRAAATVSANQYTGQTPRIIT